jgi:hypothetical protein
MFDAEYRITKVDGGLTATYLYGAFLAGERNALLGRTHTMNSTIWVETS